MFKKINQAKLFQWIVLSLVLTFTSACATRGKKCNYGPDCPYSLEKKAEKKFKKMDKNGDGKITKAEWENKFSLIDSNKNGQITLEEFKEHMKKHGHKHKCSYSKGDKKEKEDKKVKKDKK